MENVETIASNHRSFFAAINEQALRDYITLCFRGVISGGKQVKSIEGKCHAGMEGNYEVEQLLEYLHGGDYERTAEMLEQFSDIKTILRRAEVLAKKDRFNPQTMRQGATPSKPQACRPQPRILQDKESVPA